MRMKGKYRKSGIDIIEDIPWGTHICQFYRTQNDLIEILVPYFKMGLENNEFCLWVISEPLGVQEGKESLGKAVRDIDDYISKGQIEILDYSEWYTKLGKFNTEEVLQSLIKKERQALEKGFSGLRTTGNTSWLKAEDWVVFKEYEVVMDSIIGEHRMISLCNYSLDRCESSEVLDVIKNHEITIIKRNGLWHTVESDERRRLKKVLIASEIRFRRLFETAQDGILIIDANTGQITDVNPFLKDILGYTTEELLDKRLWEIGLFRDKVKSENTFKELQREGYIRYEDLQLRTKDGKAIDVEFISNVYDVDNKKIIQCNIRDIHKRKELKELSDQYKKHLEELVEQRTGELEEANRALLYELSERKQAQEREKQLLFELNSISRLAAIGEMAAGIAHEINNPLSGVIGFSELLLKKKIPKDIRKNVTIIYEGAHRIANVTDRLLKFARQSKPERTRVDINEIIENTLAMRASEMKTGNISVTTKFDTNLSLTYADAGLLQQVFLNIVLNAEQAMKSAHGKGNLEVKTERINNTIRVSFKDDGLGIARKNMDKLFSPFFTTKEVGQGTGLGLSLCYGIVKQHDGKIYARSILGKGTTFFIELPVVIKSEQLKLSEPAACEPKSAAKARILLVDDEPMVHRFLTALLTEEGHEIEIAVNGNDAMERLDNKDYDVILLDIKLPGMGGIEIYEELQKKNTSITKKVIFITGDVMCTDTMDFLSRAKPAYITKPFDSTRLVVEIYRIMSQYS
jgi:PAS domain S-box-containing protein